AAQDATGPYAAAPCAEAPPGLRQSRPFDSASPALEAGAVAGALPCLLGAWTWLSFALVSTVGFVICLVLFLLTLPLDPTRRWTGRGIRITGRAMMSAVPAWRFSIHGPLPDRLP